MKLWILTLPFVGLLLTAFQLIDEFTIKAEVNGRIFDVQSLEEHHVKTEDLKDSVRINLKVFLDGEDASATHYIFSYEVKLKRMGGTLYQMNYKRGQEYNFFPTTAREMIQPGDVIEFKMSNFTYEDEMGVHTQMLEDQYRSLTVLIK